MINLTIPKTKDLVNRPVEQYSDMINTINKKQPISKTSGKNETMKNELKDFLKQKMSSALPEMNEPLKNGFNSSDNYYKF